MNRHRLFGIVLLLAVVLDQATKVWVKHSILPQQQLVFIPRVLYVTLTYNKGIAFGLLQNVNWLTIPLSIAVILGALAIHISLRDEGRWTAVCLGLLIGGAASNMFDRIVYGKVTDFLDLRWWPVFNLADSLILLAVLILGIRWVFFSPAPHTPVPAEQAPEKT